MMNHSDWLARLLLLAPAAFLLSCQRSEVPLALRENGPVRIETGRPFPDIVLPSLKDGSPMWLRQFRGRKVLLHVFASW